MAESASGAQSYLALTKQVPATPRTIPNNPVMQKVNFSSEKLGMNIKTNKSKHIRNDRMTSGITISGFDVSGDYDFEFQYENSKDDELLCAALMSENWSTAISDLDISGSEITLSNNRISFVNSANAPTIIAGQVLKISGTAENDGFYELNEVSGTPDVYEMSPAPIADETLSATAKLNGSMIRNGTFKQPFFIERGHTDIQEFFKFLGMVVDKLTLSFKDQSEVTGKYSFVGLQLIEDDHQIETGATYNNPADTIPFSTATNLVSMLIDGTIQDGCFIKDLDFTIDNNQSAKTGLGIYGACSTNAHSLSITGKINMYFEDVSTFSKFKKGTPFSLRWVVSDGTGHGYVFSLLRCQISKDAINVKSADSDVMENASFVCSADNVKQAMIQIDKF